MVVEDGVKYAERVTHITTWEGVTRPKGTHICQQWSWVVHPVNPMGTIVEVGFVFGKRWSIG